MRRNHKQVKFFSKRNNVVLDHGLVIKTFNEDGDFGRELSVYRKLIQSDFSLIPHINRIDEQNKQLALEYLEGPTMLDRLEALETLADVDMAVKVLLAVFNWLDGFYGVFSEGNQVMGDVNLRNFIWYKASVYGIDFEKSGHGDSLEEKAEVLARYLLYDPVESGFKVTVAKEVIDQLDLSDQFEDMIRNKVEAIKVRRSQMSNSNKGRHHEQ